MATTITKYHDVTVLTVKEELSADALESFLEKGRSAIEEGSRQLVVDCSHVHGFDSLGLEALVDIQSLAEERLGAVKLCGLDETCGKILEITRLSRRFEVFDDLDSAVKSFG